MTGLVFYAVVIALKSLSVASDQLIIASSPNLMRVGNEETVVVSLHNGIRPVNVTVKLKLFERDDKGVISESVVNAGEDPVRAVLYVDPTFIPSVESKEAAHRYAYVTVSCQELDFKETKEVLLSYEEGFLFIQTDKPVYTPNQSVKIRVISLDQYLSPSPQEVQLDIVTPQDVIVKRNNFEEDAMRNGILSNTFAFHQEPMFGHWKIVAHYGKDLRVNKTVEFEVKEYVLPTFSVKIHPPAYILPTDENIRIRVESKYVYGKTVRGRLFMKVGVQEEDEERAVLHTEGAQLNQGQAVIEIDTNVLGEDWFEHNVNSSLYIEVSVVEDSTGHFENASDSTARFVRSPYAFSWKRTVRYFKKGLPYEVKTDLKFWNGKPAPGVRVKVIAKAKMEGQENTVILRGARKNQSDVDRGLEPTEDDTNAKGQVNFRLYVPRPCTEIQISLETDVPELRGRGVNASDNNAGLKFNIYPFESPTGNEFLVLRVSDQVIRPNGKLEVELFLNSATDAPVVHYFVVSRGKLMQYGRKMLANIDGFSIRVSYEMVPSARIVAYYISDEDHIIADSIRIEIERECENSELDLTVYDMRGDAVGERPITPQSQVRLRVRGTPGTSVALLAVDQAVLLLRDYHRLTPDKMYGSMDGHGTGCGPGGGRNSEDVFMNAGLTVLTNLTLDVPRRAGTVCAVSSQNNRRKRSLETQLAEYAAEDSGKEYACKRGHRGLGEGTCAEKARRFISLDKVRDFLEAHPKRDQYREELKDVFISCCKTAASHANLRSNDIDLMDPEFIIEEPSDVPSRNDFRESWAFDIIDIPESPDGEVSTEEQPYSVPGSTTTWALQAFGLHRLQAMCVLKPVDLVVFKEMFIQLHMPYSVVRKEFVEIQATVFNYADQDRVVRMYLEVPEGICSEATPGKLSAKKEFTVNAHDARTINYMLIGLESGEFPIKVVAVSPVASDAVIKMLRVEPEGVVKTLQRSTLLNPTRARVDRQRQILENDDLECGGIGPDGIQRNCLDISLPATAIPDTASCYISITGSALGPIVTSVISGLEPWIRFPSGCAEQTMSKFAPLVYVLRYLESTESGTDENKANALSHIQSGLERVVTFRHPNGDGSFSFYGGGQSSIWLTAFVGKVYCQASEFLRVDTRISCGAIKWLMTVQRNDGSFSEGTPMSRGIFGGVQGDAATTAFALIAMKECRCVDEAHELAASAARATQFLEGQLHALQQHHVLAVVTYALALVESDRRLEANEMLRALSTYNQAKDARFWDTGGSSALSVETTGYALLAQLALDELDYSHPIVKWLSEQQNYGGRFVSTQDTVIALQALSEYSAANISGTLDMHCNVTAAENFESIMLLQEGDALVRRTQMIPPKSIKGKLMVTTRGEGVGQLNVEVKYNDLAMNIDAECRFNLEVRSERIRKRPGVPFTKGNKVRVSVCASYLGKEQTNMAILDVGLYSGFAPVSKSLENLVNGTSLINRTEISARSVIFYADHIPVNGQLCFQFEAKCEIVVGNLQHASVHVYDYYNPAEECTKFYADESTSLLATFCNDERTCACVSSRCANCTGPEGETAQDLLKVACDSAQTYGPAQQPCPAHV